MAPRLDPEDVFAQLGIAARVVAGRRPALDGLAERLAQPYVPDAYSQPAQLRLETTLHGRALLGIVSEPGMLQHQIARRYACAA